MPSPLVFIPPLEFLKSTHCLCTSKSSKVRMQHFLLVWFHSHKACTSLPVQKEVRFTMMPLILYRVTVLPATQQHVHCLLPPAPHTVCAAESTALLPGCHGVWSLSIMSHAPSQPDAPPGLACDWSRGPVTCSLATTRGRQDVGSERSQRCWVTLCRCGRTGSVCRVEHAEQS